MLIISLSEKLSHAIEKIPQESILDIYVMRKYIAYIKKNVHPWYEIFVCNISKKIL